METEKKNYIEMTTEGTMSGLSFSFQEYVKSSMR